MPYSSVNAALGPERVDEADVAMLMQIADYADAQPSWTAGYISSARLRLLAARLAAEAKWAEAITPLRDQMRELRERARLGVTPLDPITALDLASALEAADLAIVGAEAQRDAALEHSFAAARALRAEADKRATDRASWRKERAELQRTVADLAEQAEAADSSRPLPVVFVYVDEHTGEGITPELAFEVARLINNV